MGWGKRHIGVPGAMLIPCAFALCAIAVGGCAECRLPRIDPTGERVFAPPPQPASPGFKNEPGPPRPWDTVETILVPRATIAPVGSEVVLLAAVNGHDGYLRASERVEWSIAPGGVGEFVDFDHGSFCDVFAGAFERPHKVNSVLVVGSTSRRYVRLTRGTPTPCDDVTVLRGQTWVSVTSPVEGTSYVTAFAPDVYGWQRRKQTALIHWVDAQWRFPPPAINPAGSRHTFTTVVMRQTDQAPCVGWRVQYAIVDGPPAGFAPSGAPTAEVETNAAGQASVEIFQRQPVPGTNRIAIHVIQPPRTGDPSSTRLVVGSGFTSKTWSAPGLTLRKTGPAVGSVGAMLTYRIELANTGDMPAEGVVLTDEVPETMSFMSSNPQGQFTGRVVQWQIGRLGPGERRIVEVRLRAERQGSVSACAVAVSGALQAKQCVATTISLAVPAGVSPGARCVGPAGAAPPLDVRILGPDRAYVGDVLTYEIVIANRGTTTATGIVIKDRFDSGLAHATLRSPIKKALNADLPPGQSKSVGVEFRAVLAGRQCQTVEITANGGSVANAQLCTTILERAPGVAPTTPMTPTTPAPPGTTVPAPTTPTPPPGAAGHLSVSVTAPTSVTMGESVDFLVTLSNDGTQPLTNLKLVSDFDSGLEPMGASEQPGGYEGEAVYWTLASLSPGQKKEYRIRCATPGLSMTAAALRNPVAVGKQVTYILRVTNGAKKEPFHACLHAKVMADGIAPIQREACLDIRPAPGTAGEDSDVVVTADVPKEMIPAQLGTYGPARHTTQGQAIQFLPVGRIAAGETLEYRVAAQARTAGDVRLRAQVTSRNHPQPLVVEAKTTINPSQ